jgi:hypothetical protein
MSDAKVRRQETKFIDVTAIGQSAEGVVAVRGDEDGLHGAIYDFEFQLDKMLLQCYPSGQRLNPDVVSCRIFQAVALHQTLPRFAWRDSARRLRIRISCTAYHRPPLGEGLVGSCRGCNRGERCEFTNSHRLPISVIAQRHAYSRAYQVPRCRGRPESKLERQPVATVSHHGAGVNLAL